MAQKMTGKTSPLNNIQTFSSFASAVCTARPEGTGRRTVIRTGLEGTGHRTALRTGLEGAVCPEDTPRAAGQVARTAGQVERTAGRNQSGTRGSRRVHHKLQGRSLPSLAVGRRASQSLKWPSAALEVQPGRRALRSLTSPWARATPAVSSELVLRRSPQPAGAQPTSNVQRTERTSSGPQAS